MAIFINQFSQDLGNINKFNYSFLATYLIFFQFFTEDRVLGGYYKNHKLSFKKFGRASLLMNLPIKNNYLMNLTIAL